MADIFDEIKEDLRAERAQALLKRYGVVLAVIVAALILAVGGWQAWRWRAQQQANKAADVFLAAMQKTAGPPAAEGLTPPRKEALGEFATLAGNAPEGYETLARLQEAGLHVNAGDLPAALKEWDQVAGDAAADPLLRGLANLIWAQHQVDHGDPAAVEARLVPLTAIGAPWRPLALENQALLAIRTGDAAKARSILKGLASDPAASAGVQARAGGLLSRLGEEPAPAGVRG